MNCWLVNGITSKREIALGRDDEGKYTEHDTAFGLFRADQLKTVNDVYGNALPYTSLVPYSRDGLVGPQVTFFDPNYDTDSWTLAEKEHTAEGYIISNFQKYGIYAGVVTVCDETKEDDYVQVTPTGTAMDTRRLGFHTDEIPVYELDQITAYDGNATKNLNAIERENIKRGDQVIVMCDGDGVQLVINVDRSSVDGTPYRDGRGNRDDEYAIAKLLDLYQYVLIDQGAQAEINKTAAEKLAEAAAILGQDEVASGEMLVAWNLLNSIDTDDLTVPEYGQYTTLLGSLGTDGAEIVEALLGEQIDEIMSVLYEDAGDAILAVVGDSWTELPAGVDGYDDLYAYDFSSDPSLTQEQIDAIAAIIQVYTDALAAAEATDLSGYTISDTDAADANSDYNDAYVDIHNGLVDSYFDAMDEIDDIIDELVNGPSEVEGDGEVIGEPTGVTVAQDPDADELTDYSNVESVWTVDIPNTWDPTEKVEFSLVLPEGQTPYVDESELPGGVRKVDFTPRVAAEAQQMLAKVPAVTWDVKITLDSVPAEKVVILVLEESTDEPIPVPSTMVDFMSLKAGERYGILADIEYDTWEDNNTATLNCIGLDDWLTTMDSFEVEVDKAAGTGTIKVTGTVNVIDYDDITYKWSEIGDDFNHPDFIPFFGYKDYAYYSAMYELFGRSTGAEFTGKGGLNEEGDGKVDGYFTANSEWVRDFGRQFAIIGIIDPAADTNGDTPNWVAFLAIGDYMETRTFTRDGITYTIDLTGLEWN